MRDSGDPRDTLGGTDRVEDAAMKNPPTFLIHPETGPMLFTDCPFCLQPVPLDAATGSMDCVQCAVHLELAQDPEPLVLAPAA
jgi:hypothetical protein